jgi:hypothetical protein
VRGKTAPISDTGQAPTAKVRKAKHTAEKETVRHGAQASIAKVRKAKPLLKKQTVKDAMKRPDLRYGTGKAKHAAEKANRKDKHSNS